MHALDGVAVRNSGPVLGYRREYDAFQEEALREGVRVCNPRTGRADMLGRRYLLDLSAEGHPVIPTVDRAGRDAFGAATTRSLRRFLAG